MTATMDATEDNNDVKLYRASGDLLPEIRAKLPQLVYHTQNGKPGRVRRMVLYSKVDEIIQRLDRFQEWPQLLDPHLADFIQILADSFLSYIMKSADHYAKSTSAHRLYVIPLPHAVSKLLYIFCKVRGAKIIVRLLNNEPKYLEPLLIFMARQNNLRQLPGSSDQLGMTWEERYILLLWLSHLMLTPFDLASVSSFRVGVREDHTELTKGLPSIAVSLLSIALENLLVPSKERESASALIVRLALRSDMQSQHLLDKCVHFALGALETENSNLTVTAYHHVGFLSLLYGIMNSGSDDDIAPFIHLIFSACMRLATGSSQHQVDVRTSAPARKLLIKTMRSALLHAVSLNSKFSHHILTDDLDTMLEEGIQYLLEALSDKDTPVRMAASKNLAMIVLSLGDEMSAEVVHAVLDSMNENILLENIETGAVVGITGIIKTQGTLYRRNISSVDPLKWQGLMLTLGHLLFRRSPPTYQLPAIIEALISGLHFEQRSNVGSSVGVGVRDAACFGVWSLARKYSTKELMLVDVVEIRESAAQLLPLSRTHNVLQLMATELVVSACTDPSGNIRRGSSAALQELIGRHPDTITAGIPLVQIVDYHAVARRSHAMCDVAVDAAKLDGEYHYGLLNALMDWRGSKAADAESRRSAASAAGDLIQMVSISDAEELCMNLVNRISKLKASNTGLTAEIRHGFLLMLASILSSLQASQEKRNIAITISDTPGVAMYGLIWGSLDDLGGHRSGRVTRDLEFVFEALSTLIASLANLPNDKAVYEKYLAEAIEITERCITASEKDEVVDAASQAAIALFQILNTEKKRTLIKKWTDYAERKRLEYKCKGRMKTIGILYSVLAENDAEAGLQDSILAYLKDLTTEAWPVETRVNATTSLTALIKSMTLTPKKMEYLTSIITDGLTDYTLDQRGDVGSTLRLQTIDTVSQLLSSAKSSSSINPDQIKPIIAEVAKQAGEKLNKIRLRAWTCLVQYWKTDDTFPPLQQAVLHVTDVSSPAYYASLLSLLEVPWLKKHLILGLISSVAAGTEDAGRASCEALVSYFLEISDADRLVMSHTMYTVLLRHLSACAPTDDRNAIPAMEFLAFLLEQDLISMNTSPSFQYDSLNAWAAVEKFHVPTASIQRLEMITKLYSALCISKIHRRQAIDKLTRLLLHRYPKIRGGAADTLFLHTGSERLIASDWTAPVAELKQIVLQVRKELGVTAPASKNSF